MPSSEEEREEAPRQRGASNHVSSGTTGRWVEIPRRCAPSAAVSEPGFSLFLSLFLFQFYSESPGDLSRAPLNSAKHPLFPGTHPKIAKWGGSRLRSSGWREGKGRRECDL